MKQLKKSRTLLSGALVIASGLLGLTAWAAEQSYDFKDPKALNSIVVTLDAPLETANGLANGITGSVNFDPENPQNLKGKIVVDANSLKFSNNTYTDAAHSSRGLDTEKFPQITFDLKSASNIKKPAENVFEADVTGDFTLHGVTKRITVPVTATVLKGQNKARLMGNGSGDLLVLRSNFKVKRTDYGITPPLPAAVLADEVQIRVSIAGISPAK